jgi:ribosomal protein L29
MRQTQLEKAIADLEAERAAIDLALLKLRAQRSTQTVAATTPRPAAVAKDKA